MIPILSIVGPSNSGKTTLIEKLIPELKRRGCRVATIKHMRHDFTADIEGKDSWRHRQAGAAATILASPRKVAVFADTDRDYNFDELSRRFIRDADIILAEGFKEGNPFPKVEVFCSIFQKSPVYVDDSNLLAIVGDSPIETRAPYLDRNDVSRLADIIVDRLLKKSSRPK